MADSFLIPSNLFSGPRAADLLPELKHLLACFWANPFQTAAGAFCLHEGMMQEYSSIKAGAILNAIPDLERRELVLFDSSSKELFVCDWWRTHKCKNDRQRQIVATALAKIVSPTIRKAVLEALKNNGYTIEFQKINDLQPNVNVNVNVNKTTTTTEPGGAGGGGFSENQKNETPPAAATGGGADGDEQSDVDLILPDRLQSFKQLLATACKQQGREEWLQALADEFADRDRRSAAGELTAISKPGPWAAQVLAAWHKAGDPQLSQGASKIAGARQAAAEYQRRLNSPPVVSAPPLPAEAADSEKAGDGRKPKLMQMPEFVAGASKAKAA